MSLFENCEANLKSHVAQLCRAPRTPHSAGYFLAHDYIIDAFTKLDLEPKKHEFKTWLCGTGTNFYTESGPADGPRVLIGAHYESRDCSGVAADDNASAVAVVLELARILSQVSKQAFTFVLYDMEENYRLSALRESKAFARDYSKPLEKIIIMDLVGGSLAPGFENIYLQFGEAFPRLELDGLKFLHLPMIVMEPFGGFFPRSDYDAYRDRNIPFSFFSIGNPWYYHTEFDTPEILDFSKMRKLTEAFVKIVEGKNVGAPPDYSDFQTFISVLNSTKELQHPLFEKLLSENRAPTRWEIVKLYKHVLPILRKRGPDLSK